MLNFACACLLIIKKILNNLNFITNAKWSHGYMQIPWLPFKEEVNLNICVAVNAA